MNVKPVDKSFAVRKCGLAELEHLYIAFAQVKTYSSRVLCLHSSQFNEELTHVDTA